MIKRLIPILNTPRLYSIQFSSPLYYTRSNDKVVTSTSFTYNGVTSYIQDRAQTLGSSEPHSDKGGTHTLEIYKLLNNNKITTVSDIGYIIADQGLVVLEKFTPSAISGDYITITGIPNSNDIAPKRKVDPNIQFPWILLAQKGYGLWFEPNEQYTLPASISIPFALAMVGYDVKDTTAALLAFKRHFRSDSTSVVTENDRSVLFQLIQNKLSH
jgi:hypothetical protein